MRIGAGNKRVSWMNRVGAEERKGMRTTVDGVCLRVIPNVRSLGLRDLHETVFLELSEREVLLVPLQAAWK